MQTLVAFFLTIGAVVACSVAALAGLGYVSFQRNVNVDYAVPPTPKHPELLFVSCASVKSVPSMGANPRSE